VIEKMGIFTRLVEDKFFDTVPCILLCGKGYPSVATRAMLAMMDLQLKYESLRAQTSHCYEDCDMPVLKGIPSSVSCLNRIPVVGLADYNPHGLALLRTYSRGGVNSSMEGEGHGKQLGLLSLTYERISFR
jgi:DNA topoisomerase VI subunit A